MAHEERLRAKHKLTPHEEFCRAIVLQDIEAVEARISQDSSEINGPLCPLLLAVAASPQFSQDLLGNPCKRDGEQVQILKLLLECPKLDITAYKDRLLFAALRSKETLSLLVLLLYKKEWPLPINVNIRQLIPESSATQPNYFMLTQPLRTPLHAALESSNFAAACLLANDPETDSTIPSSKNSCAHASAYTLNQYYLVQKAKAVAPVKIDTFLRAFSHSIELAKTLNLELEECPTEFQRQITELKKNDMGFALALPLFNRFAAFEDDFIRTLAENGALITWDNEQLSNDLKLLLSAFFGIFPELKRRRTPKSVTELILERAYNQATVNEPDAMGFTPLMWATAGCGIDRVCFLFAQYSVNPNASDERGFTALHLAALNGDAVIVRFLLGVDAVNIDQKTISRKKGLFYADMRTGVTALTLTKRRARAYAGIGTTAVKRYAQVIACFSELHQRRRAFYLSLVKSRDKNKLHNLDNNICKALARLLHLAKVDQEGNVIITQSNKDTGD